MPSWGWDRCYRVRLRVRVRVKVRARARASEGLGLPPDLPAARDRPKAVDWTSLTKQGRPFPRSEVRQPRESTLIPRGFRAGGRSAA